MIIDLLEKIFPWKNSLKSGDDAKHRLKFILAHDRADLNPEMVEAMRADILAVVKRYVDIDSEQMEFSLESDQRMTALIANLPIRRVKRDTTKIG
ncbi:MAG: cell division topological specificity factor MinE [Candidatus Atelocyanobacterium thalassa isolate SIO64986]|uniref:Cell division topological specificity factor n=1 Tax=Candidatus Atelocyanobacterium thalassa isolate SIO64986 TaxID=1527444 RepID=A0A086CIF3_9CHRO|nr:MAG: cell division topological specificity factor MinE [Candidatus Atelocyanobacterium thalassa isolate SIO64986]